MQFTVSISILNKNKINLFQNLLKNIFIWFFLMSIFSTSLFARTLDGFYDTVYQSIGFEGDPNIKDLHGNTLLHNAVMLGSKEQIKVLLEDTNIDVNVEDKHGRTALYLAVFKGDIEIVDWLLSRINFDVNAKNENSDTAFHYATRIYTTSLRNIPIVDRLLLSTKIDVNAKNENGDTALHCAVSRGDFEIVDKLLSSTKIDVNAKDENGYTAFHLAARKRDFKIADMLLLIAKVDINAKNREGCTAFHLAANQGDLEIVDRLLSSTNVDRLLLGTHIDVNAQDDKGWTALHLAVRKGKVKIVHRLLSTNIDVNAQDDEGWTALHWAICKGEVKIVDRLLLITHIDINARNVYDETILDYATYHLAEIKKESRNKTTQSLKVQANTIKHFIMYKDIERSEIQKLMFILFTMHLSELSVLEYLFDCCPHKDKIEPLKYYKKLYERDQMNSCKELYPRNYKIICQLMS